MQIGLWGTEQEGTRSWRLASPTRPLARERRNTVTVLGVSKGKCGESGSGGRSEE